MMSLVRLDHVMKPGARLAICAAMIIVTLSAPSSRRIDVAVIAATASEQAAAEAAPIYGITLPAGYRDWTLISIARVGAPLNDMRAKLGHAVARKAYRQGTLPFPDGTVIARLAWSQATSEENNNALRPILERSLGADTAQKVLAESFVAGPPTNVQFMVKDSKKYSSSGGWGFAQFNDGKPADEAVHKTCFPCHSPAKDRDFVFTRYSR